MKLYSDEHNDSIGINKKLYDEFIEDSKSMTYFDEERINSLIYHLYTAYEDVNPNITKERLLNILSLSLNELSIDELMELKPNELFALLDSDEKNFIEAYKTILDSYDTHGVFF